MNSCQNCSSKTDKLFEMDSSCFRNNSLNIATGNKIHVCEKCKTYFEKRARKLDDIIRSNSDKRLIVAGPGTGKTHTFKEVIKNMRGDKNVLIFTLINNLADELSKEFEEPEFENVNVKTFHGYCESLLYGKLGKSHKYYPELPIIIEEDSLFLDKGYTKKHYHDALTNIDDSNHALQFFFQRSAYYKAIGHNDSVYTVYKELLKNKDKIPRYDLIIADEYQDFNKLEASFIELLAEKNKILIAGDDDQALYHFRNSSNKFIRDLYNKRPDFEKFDLPYTSRCTEVVVKTIDRFIEAVKAKGLLQDRLPKDYVSYWPDKYIYDSKYKYIQVANCSTPTTAEQYIRNRIEQITKHEKLTGNEKDIQFLIIGSETQFRLDSLAKYLESIIDKTKYTIIKKEDKEEINISYAFGLIHKDKKNNLGWRIIMYKYPPLKAREIIKKTYQDNSFLYDNLPKEYISRFEKTINDYFLKLSSSSEDNELSSESQDKKIIIKLTNCLGSKGLSALHVIVTEFHNGVFPSEKNCKYVNDDDIFRCIVSLTRAKRSCALVTFKEYYSNIRKTISRDSCLLKVLPQDCLNRTSYRIVRGKLIRVT